MRPWIAALCALAVTGLVLVLAGDGAADPIGIGLIGLASVGAVSLGFYAVGRSEDAARAKEEQARRPPGPDDPPPGDGRLTARRPPRSRGDS